MPRPALTPRMMLATLMLIGALLAWTMPGLATRAPWLGVDLLADAHTVRIALVYPEGPAAGKLIPGDSIHYIHGVAGERVTITPVTLMEEPDMLPSYAEYNAFFTAQTRLHRVLSGGTVVLETSRGEITIDPATRPITSMPLVFWFQLACGFIAAFTGMSIWVFRPASIAARKYALTGVSFLLVTFTAAVYSGRELAVDGDLFRLLSVLNHLGAMLFSGAFIGLFLHYPADLGHRRMAQGVLGGYLLIWLFDTLQWLPSPDWGIRIPVILGLCFSGVFALLQWRRSRQQPLERAALKWFLFSVYFSGTIFVTVIFVTVLLGLPPPLSQGYAFGVVTAMYLGVALGITRHRLFDLERWWFTVWLWLFVGAALIAADLMLVYVLQLTQGLALGLSLAVIGWVYFPLRQWLAEKLVPGERRRMDSLYPQLLHLGLVSVQPDSLSRSWHQLLQNTFDPLHIAELDQAVAKARVSADGLALDLPGIGGLAGLRISFHQGGRRLFSSPDAQLAQVLWVLAQRAVHDRDAYERGMRVERERIARDLHDDIGGRLLTITHRTSDVALAELARDALRDLRAVVANLTVERRRVGEVVANWHAEMEERCLAAGMELVWEEHGLEEDRWLSARQHINLQRVLREAISNALRHASADRIELRIVADAEQFELTVRDHGQGIVSNHKPGHGLANMRRRMADLGGSLTVETDAVVGVTVRAILPWTMEEGQSK